MLTSTSTGMVMPAVVAMTLCFAATVTVTAGL
jgi:hypothetical protein